MYFVGGVWLLGLAVGQVLVLMYGVIEKFERGSVRVLLKVMVVVLLLMFE